MLCAVNESIYNGPSVCKAGMCCFESWRFWCLILCIICLISCVDKIDECRSLVGRPIPSLVHSSTKVLFFEAAIQTLGGFALFKEERTDEKGAGQVAAISNCSGYHPEFDCVTCSFLKQRPTIQLRTIQFDVVNISPSVFETVVLFVTLAFTNQEWKRHNHLNDQGWVGYF